MQLLNRTAIITGAASGIGRATALRFASEGAKVVVADINDTGGSETVQQIKAQGAEAKTGDVPGNENHRPDTDTVSSSRGEKRSPNK